MEITRNLLEKLDEFFDELSDKYYINRGGCCYTSYALARKLEELHIRYKLIIFDGNGYCDKSLDARKHIRNREGIYTGYDSRNHYTIQINGYIINRGHFAYGYAKTVVGCIKSEDIKYLYDKGNWNTYYNKNNNKKVYKLISKFFDEYEE